MNTGKKVTVISVATATLASLFVNFLPEKKTSNTSFKKWFGNKNIKKAGKIFGKASKKSSIYSRFMRFVHFR